MRREPLGVWVYICVDTYKPKRFIYANVACLLARWAPGLLGAGTRNPRPGTRKGPRTHSPKKKDGLHGVQL